MPKVTRQFKFATSEQQAVFDDMTSPAILVCGAWGSGKTEVALQKVLYIAAMDPGASVLCCGWLRPTAQRLFKLFVDGEGANPAVCPRDWIVGEPNKADMHVKVRSSNGRPVSVQFSGLKPGELDITRIQGTQFSFVLVEEATQIREARLVAELETRSGRVPGAKFYQFMLLCNAEAPGHWLHQRFYERKGGKPGDRLIELPTIPEHLGILPGHYYRRLEALTGMLAARYRDNKWVGFEGLVYPYDPREQLIHHKDDAYYNVDGLLVVRDCDLVTWPCVQSADIGYDHPTVYQWWRVSPDDRWFLQREVYMSGRAMSVHAKTVLDECKRLGVPPYCYHDPSAALAVQEWQNMGITCTPAVNDRIAGQRAVVELFPHAIDAAGTQMSPCRIYFCDDALVEQDIAQAHAGKPMCTVDEFGTYVWATGTREDMCKKDDDGMDAMRYAVASGRPRVPNLGVCEWQS